mmetsp:Transcript_103723/g.270134  ORF Transcript_103723/g.270134 Transcript_103723/m.270134 type:complete len:213 (+) Transcript_103723:925-1563(+)
MSMPSGTLASSSLGSTINVGSAGSLPSSSASWSMMRARLASGAMGSASAKPPASLNWLFNVSPTAGKVSESSRFAAAEAPPSIRSRNAIPMCTSSMNVCLGGGFGTRLKLKGLGSSWISCVGSSCCVGSSSCVGGVCEGTRALAVAWLGGGGGAMAWAAALDAAGPVAKAAEREARLAGGRPAATFALLCAKISPNWTHSSKLRGGRWVGGT